MDTEKAAQLPEPSGYRMLCAVPPAEESFDSGIIKPDQVIRTEMLLATVLFVVKMGPD